MTTVLKLMLLSLLTASAFAMSSMPPAQKQLEYGPKHAIAKEKPEATYCERRDAANKVAKALGLKGFGKGSI